MEFQTLIRIFEQDQVITPEKKQELEKQHSQSPISVQLEFRIMLYLGVMLLTTGIGFLVYQNIDTIGHSILILLIGLGSLGCLAYVAKKSKPFSREEIKQDSPFLDYILLLGAILFLTCEGYLQFQYQVFGNRYGIATLITALVFVVLAYRFDHKGVLSMAITAFSGWLGLSVTPGDFFDNSFSTEISMITAIAWGTILSGLAYLSRIKHYKAHFFFTYLNFGTQLLLLAALTGTIMSEYYLIYFLVLCIAVFLMIRYAKHEQSNYFFLTSSLYGYIGVSTLYFKLIDKSGFHGDDYFWFFCLYFMISCGAIIFFILNFKKLLSK